MFRAVLCSSSGGHIVLLQHLVSSLSVNGCTVCRLTFLSLLVTLRTTTFNIQKILHGAHTVFRCFVRISEERATFVLYSIDRLRFCIEVESVYCAVRTESLYNTDDCHVLHEPQFQHSSGAIGVELHNFVKRD
jgi:hypothetical protein